MGLGNKIKRIREGVEIDKLIKNLYGTNPYLEGYVFVDNGKVLGYAMLAKSFSTEYGKPCIWIEDIYLKPEYCGMGIGTKFFDFIDKKYQGYIRQ